MKLHSVHVENTGEAEARAVFASCDASLAALLRGIVMTNPCVIPLARPSPRDTDRVAFMANVWSAARRSPTVAKAASDHRNAFEHDYDRLLFSTPVRRLADKTQVFPLDRNDAVRTRLTHSHEVANLARSMGVRLISESVEFKGMPDARTVPAILSAIGLAHDLGNPPFGHQGEAAIGQWFKKKGSDIFTSHNGESLLESQTVPERLWPEFIEFEGNAQTFRILTRLQVAAGGFGLDLTAATLNALLKYAVPCDKRNTSAAQARKFGYFESEIEIVRWVRSETGIDEGERHPLTWIMEAADDIAYSVLDIEDAIRKGILSPDDVHAIIEHRLDGQYLDMRDFINRRFSQTRNGSFSISGTREVMSSYLRTALIQTLLDECIQQVKLSKKQMENFSLTKGLMDSSLLLRLLKEIAQNHVFVVADVRKIEADGFHIIDGLMEFYWHAISHRKLYDDLLSKRMDARAAYGISKLSDNYLQCAAYGQWPARDGGHLPMRYRELRLLTDMVSGMTDGFAKAEYDSLSADGFLSW